MILPTMVAIRQSLRTHQGLATDSPMRLPLWRLVIGEIVWALQELLGAPATLIAMAVGVAGTLAILGGQAPGPFVQLPARILLAVAVGLLFAGGLRAVVSTSKPSTRESAAGPLTAATVVAGAIAAVTLLIWLGVWVIAATT